MFAQDSSLAEKYSVKPDSYYGNTRPEMLPFIPRSAKRILEVGCSSGAFGELVKEKLQGCEVWGIEPSVEAAAAASKRLDVVIVGTFAKGIPELTGTQFDCIVFNDVLEHLPAPEKALKDSIEYLVDGGTVVASIPNILYFPEIYEILTTEDWKYKECGVLDNTHLRFFTRKSIFRMFGDSGFNDIDIQGINPYPGRRYKVLNYLLLNRLRDWRFLQFAVKARIDRTKKTTLLQNESSQ